MISKKICLITGSTGLIGSESAKYFIKKKFNVIGIDNNLRSFFFGKTGSTINNKNYLIKNFKKYEHKNFDIRNEKELIKIFKKKNTKLK